MRAEFERLQADSPHNTGVAPSHYRWMWLDRFVEFVVPRRAVAVKNVSLAEEPIDLYMPGFPVMPCSLIIEGLGLTGGILVGASQSFQKQIVLAKLGKAVFHRPAVPGDRMTYSVEIESLQPGDAKVRGTSYIDGQLHAEVEMIFACLDDRMFDVELIGPADVLTCIRTFGLYDVACCEDGSLLSIPERMLSAERAAADSFDQPEPARQAGIALAANSLQNASARSSSGRHLQSDSSDRQARLPSKPR
jgi:3-hydroxyacyl-[acyl-carrier-protein] dehydratase